MTTRRTGDAGETLIEVVIAIAIMGVAFVALLGGMLTAVSMSSLHRQQADAQLQLVSVAEQVKAAQFRRCADVGDYPQLDPGDTIEYWNGVAFGSTCVESYPLQRITVRITSADGRVSRTDTILKRGRVSDT